MNIVTNIRFPQKQTLLEQLLKYLSQELSYRSTTTIVWLTIYMLWTLT